jgi:isopenicillin-N epimerase
VTAGDQEWAEVRDQFDLSPEFIHMSALLLSSHPRPVREAIDRHRRELDRNPVTYLQDRNAELQDRAREAAASYVGGEKRDIALTDSTTMGLGLVYNGLRLRPGDEILTTEHDYYATHEALRLAAEKSGATVRQIPLYASLPEVSAEEIVHNIVSRVRPATRVVALTWVHSGTGLKLPLREISEGLRKVSAGSPDDRPVLLCVDGVHGFGVENLDVTEAGCDFFMAGAHKWLFGPRGTGIIWGNERGWSSVSPTIPTFVEDASWQAWIEGTRPPGPPRGERMSPGGFKPFEHQWAMTEAFEFHQKIGKERVERRTHALASRLKQGLSAMAHVELHTPMSEVLSSGIVCFDVRGDGPDGVIRTLRDRGVIATVTPYATRYARLTPGILNTEQEVDAVLEEIERLA